MDQTLASTANHALEACERMLRPIMRLALDRGLKYQDIDELIRGLMLDEAARDWAKRNGKEPSGSQLSVTTGINRKEVKRRASAASESVGMPNTQKSIAAQVFMVWMQRANGQPSLRHVPVQTAELGQTTFATIAQSAVRDVHFRSVLDELIRLRLVAENSGHVELLTNAYVPQGKDSEKLALITDNCVAHMDAAIQNLSEQHAPLLEQAIWGEGIALADCQILHLAARDEWKRTQKALFDLFEKTPEASTTQPRHEIRIGMYVHHTSMTEGKAS
jgi:hypothetical protein